MFKKPHNFSSTTLFCRIFEHASDLKSSLLHHANQLKFKLNAMTSQMCMREMTIDNRFPSDFWTFFSLSYFHPSFLKRPAHNTQFRELSCEFIAFNCHHWCLNFTSQNSRQRKERKKRNEAIFEIQQNVKTKAS